MTIKVISVGRTGLTGKDGTVITVNDIAAIDDNITLTSADVGADADGAAAQALEDANAYTDDGLALKLDAADYVQHFLGKFATVLALETAHATANNGDYAIVDTGVGVDARQYVWDADDGWVDSGEVKSGTTTDQITEGSTNFYFTSSRVRDVVLTGLSLVTGTAITALDTVLSAFGKLQKQINDLFSNQRYVIETDASATYTIPASFVTENGRTIVELSNNSLTSITINAATATGKTAGDSVTVEITGTYAAQTLVADGVTLNGTAVFSANAKIKTLIYRGSNTWKVMGG